MSTPLELSYHWQMPVALSTVVAALVIAFVRQTHGGWLAVAAVVVLLWAAFLVSVYLRTRAYLRVDGSELTVRRYGGLHTVSGPQVSRVTEFLTQKGPCHKLIVAAGDRTEKCAVPTALLVNGHSTLFGWLLRHAPQAELDKGSQKTLERLRLRGLVE
jgi:hypothetical protein